MSPVRPLAARPWTVYPVDAVLAVALLVGGAVLIASGPALIMTLLGSVLCLLGAGIAYAANGTAIWLSSAHTAQHSTDLAGARTSLRHRRNVGRALPCPYPDAWYAVALSAELPPGGILDAVVCGRSLVIFRPARGGLPSVLDAYCSHNGAHLAHGGSRLVGDCIRCPFHGWCFDAQGRAVSTGVGDRPPPGSDLRAWPVLERNGVVSVWMAAAGHAVPASPTKPAEVAAPAPPKAPAAASLDPWWEPPVFPELNGGGGYVYHGCSEHLVPALIYELPENGADVVHLTELHTDFVVKSLRSLLCVRTGAGARGWGGGERGGEQRISAPLTACPLSAAQVGRRVAPRRGAPAHRQPAHRRVCRRLRRARHPPRPGPSPRHAVWHIAGACSEGPAVGARHQPA